MTWRVTILNTIVALVVGVGIYMQSHVEAIALLAGGVSASVGWMIYTYSALLNPALVGGIVLFLVGAVTYFFFVRPQMGLTGQTSALAVLVSTFGLGCGATLIGAGLGRAGHYDDGRGPFPPPGVPD